ncbi:uncharacterized protein UTRI_00640_B [Ustilago trichophora]|uniref:Uncharacterized protein n=1 Tax=Ustilago trichophora TaxID=86804 RepID=A0A5C3DPR0_9BASI|nr:uncharacterized protein UTRI_00640_B [Ustilago trichophora]
MVSLPRFFHAPTADELVTSSPSPSIPATSGSLTANMSRHGSNSTPVLGSPGSLKAVFGASDPRESIMSDEYVDEVLPEYVQCSILGSSAPFGRRSRLDDSAGEGLRRNVLVRNAMLSSLERERRQMAEEVSAYETIVSTTDVELASTASAMDEEAQFFEDLLAELSGSECSSSTSDILEPSTESSAAPASNYYVLEQSNDEEDFVQLDSDLPEPLHTQLVSLAGTNPAVGATTAVCLAVQDEAAISTVPTLVDSRSSAFSGPPGCDDSGFAEEASRPPSAASCCTGYPNVCPYPATTSYVGGSSEELPALIDDDSDVDDDDDEVDEQVLATREPVQAAEAGPEVAALLSPDGDTALSRPLSPVTSPVHSVYADFSSFRDPLSPEPSRPTSPISSASSKGDGDGPSPLLLATDLGALPSLAELSLQLPAATGADLYTPRPSRALAGAWFENKSEAPSGSSTNADRMRWTTSPATYFRPLSAASSSSSVPDFHHNRFGADLHRTSYPTVAATDPADHSIVVHWSR